MSSSIIDPIIQVQHNRKLATVAITLTGANAGSKAVPGLSKASQILGAYLTGGGTTATAFALLSAFVAPDSDPGQNVVGVSTTGNTTTITANILVQGY